MNTASFTLGQDPLLQQAQIAQQALRQDEAQLLALQQAGGSRPLDTGTYQVVNFDPIIKAMTQKRLKAEIEANKKKQLDLTGAYQAKMADALKGYHSRKAGEKQVLPLLDDSGEAVTNQLPGNPRAFQEGLQSPIPEVQELAKADQTQYQANFKELLGKASLASGQKALAQGQDFAALQPRKNVQFNEGLPYDVSDEGKITPLGHTGFKQEPDARGGMANRNTFNNKLAGGQGQTINVGGAAADTEYLKTVAKQAAEKGETMSVSLLKGFRALGSVEKAAEEGAFQGPLSRFVQTAVGVGNQLGLTSAELNGLLARTEIINGGMGNFVREALKATGYNPSNTDLVFTKETVGGQELSPAGLAALIRAARTDMVNEAILHNQKVEELAKKLPSVEMSRVKIPDLSNLDPKKQRELARTAPDVGRAHNVFGFAPGGADSPFYMPTDQAPAPKPAAALSPAERAKRLRELGVKGY